MACFSGYYHETQITANLLAVDGSHDPVVLALNAASAGLARSTIPWNGPIGAARVGMVGDRFILNPVRKQLNSPENRLNLVVAGTTDSKAVMLEAEGRGVDRHCFLDAVAFGLERCRVIAGRIAEECHEAGVEKRTVVANKDYESIERDMVLLCAQKVKEVYLNHSLKKVARDKAVFAIRDAAIQELKSVHESADKTVLADAFSRLCRSIVADLVFDDDHRVDGRGANDIREIHCEADLHPPLHGSSLFQRGETQVFSTVALDSPDSTLKADAVSVLTGGIKEKNFFLHYEFPQYATNDIGKAGPAGRRELGHGALAEKALKAIVPKDHPFTIRLSSEVLESNGSSSMATVCGGTMALYDAGVPVSAPAAGIAMGLVSRSKNHGEMEYKAKKRPIECRLIITVVFVV